MKKSDEVIKIIKCACGCGQDIQIKKGHLAPSKTIPKLKRGHGQEGNKKGWKSGQTTSNGYVYVYSPNHPFKNACGKGYVKRSRLVIEKDQGFYLSTKEHVHHINGIRDDDRLENLQVISRSEHLSKHHKESVKDQKRDKTGKFIKGGLNVVSAEH